MANPAGPVLGAVHLNDGVYTNFRWNEEQGLSSPAIRPIGSIQSTFNGPVRIVPNGSAYQEKEVILPGYLLQVGGLAEGYDRVGSFYGLAGTSGTVSVLQVGLLGLKVIPEPPVVEKLKAHRVQLDYSVRSLAVPGVWTALFAQYLGSTYGVVLDGSSSRSTAFVLDTGSIPGITNLGTAPTPIVLTISMSGPRTARFFVRCTAPGYTKRISVTPESGGVTKITESHGLYVPPGFSTLRYEEANGTAITGITVNSSIYGTRWRYESLDDSLSDVGPAVLYNTRQSRGYAATAAFTTSIGLVAYEGDTPRFGLPGTYNANTIGLLVEPDRTNSCLQSQALATAPWTATMFTVTNNNSTAPDGTTTSTRIQNTAGMAGSVLQSITLAANPWVISCYVRGTGSIVLSAAGLGTLTITPGTNWARYELLVTGTAAAYNIGLIDNAMAACDVQVWGFQVEQASGRTAAVATSYIPTTTVAVLSAGDSVGTRPLENILAWSNSFWKTTAVSGTEGLWYNSGATLSTTRQTGPQDVVDAQSIQFTGAGQYVEQRLIGGDRYRTTTVGFSIWMRNSTSTPASNVSIRIIDSAGSFTELFAGSLNDQWRRLSIQRTLTGFNINTTVQIRSSGAQTIYVAHAHAFILSTKSPFADSETTQSISAPYIETFANPYFREQSWQWPEWLTQNGYLEADVCQMETSRPNLSGRNFLGDGSGAYTVGSNTVLSVQRDGSASSATNSVVAYRRQSNGTLRSASSSAINMHDGAFHKLRIEWVNYLVSSVRTAEVRLYIDGTLRQSTAISGDTRWSNDHMLRVCGSALQAFQTMKNIVIGSPSLPSGAVPEPY